MNHLVLVEYLLNHLGVCCITDRPLNRVNYATMALVERVVKPSIQWNTNLYNDFHENKDVKAPK